MHPTLFNYQFLSGRPLGFYDSLREATDVVICTGQHLSEGIVYSGLELVHELSRVIRPHPEVILGKQLGQQAKKKGFETAKTASVKGPSSGKTGKGAKSAGGGSIVSKLAALGMALRGGPGRVLIELDNGEFEEVSIPIVCRGSCSSPGLLGAKKLEP